MITAARGLWIAALVVGIGGSPASAVPVHAPAPAGDLAPVRGTAPASAVPPFRSIRTYPAIALPVRIRVPEQGIDSGLERLGLAPDGSIAAPSRWQVAGWYAAGPRPGQQGPAVIVGHVDSPTGPAVFFRLAELRPGDAVYVDRQDGTSARFRVIGRQEVPKDRFPADRVYSPTLQASLLLMTCGGIFDVATGHYRDNVIISTVPG
ncbi:MAG TPA: class F sortase [Kineosporiaceae bacterium]|nr:class F sortase [Kineosporiaceae bacterium]